MKIDVLFIDPGCSKPYNHLTPESEPLGGTEGATVRLAEGLGSLGYKVCVAQKFDFIPITSPNKVRYVPIRWLNNVTPSIVIHIRARMHFDKFPLTKQFAWLHDACYLHANNMSDWQEYADKYQVKCIAVSDWHVQNIKSLAPGLDVKKLYSPTDQHCYDRFPDGYDKNQLVWLSSPHKGLGEGIEVFYKLLEKCPEMKLVVFNPGYFNVEIDNGRGIVMMPNSSRETLRNVTAKSLCVFYPTKFEETFGSIASEANALGTPVACYKVAGLAESVSKTNGWFNNEEELIEGVLKWRDSRPIVSGQDQFRISEVLRTWEEALGLQQLRR